MTSLAGNDWRRTDKGLACAEKEIKIIEFIGASSRVHEDYWKDLLRNNNTTCVQSNSCRKVQKYYHNSTHAQHNPFPVASPLIIFRIASEPVGLHKSCRETTYYQLLIWAQG